MRGLPYNTQEADLYDFLGNIKLMKEDLVFKFFENGKFSGEAVVRLHNQYDFDDVMAMNLTRLGHRYIEMIESS